jgi:hypothetical protein
LSVGEVKGSNPGLATRWKYDCYFVLKNTFRAFFNEFFMNVERTNFSKYFL